MEQTASNAVLTVLERSSINNSITTLQTRLKYYFGDEVTTHFQFGSSTRGTILPRSMDSHSDIDYMVVFSDSSLTPQTYLNKLKRFVEFYYQQSEIFQSNPTIVLNLSHIKFELVPAIQTELDKIFGNYQIPNKQNSWMNTTPNSFNASLVSKNTNNLNLIKPTIRLLKYWNAKSDYPFDSFGLEKWLCDQHFVWCYNQKDYFFESINKLNVDFSSPKWIQDEITRAKKIVRETIELEQQNCPVSAELKIKTLFRL